MEVSKYSIEFPKISLKLKIAKHFMRHKQQATQKKLFSLPQTHPHQTKSYYFSGTKIFLQRYTAIYRDLLSKCFKYAIPGRQEMVQYNFFSHTKQKHVFCKTFKVRKAFGFLQEHIIFNSN